ncbi:divergent polysaccharide deacetylase family protein [Loktanella sp. TSTF-M6]|uniref:Divergent polysaccharide deacetylase family protein n=1 Tax=Loktanella gaetbuli TaxID=2881335 RepID=A0ABS8BR82_9RHOB|nr:divergent polysaccharide deacetylase family protein [Loktanella gaetbuli]MCB5198244.1 divergent polysaccharide deacetylase family protein [Loktanella gaetbuli]
MAFVKGAAWGVVVGGMAVATGSLLAPQPVGNTPPVLPQTEAPQANATPEPLPDVALIEAPEASQPADMTEPALSSPTVEAQTPTPETQSAQTPDPAVIEPELVSPEPDTTVSIATAPEEPVLPNPQSLSPQVPASEADVALSTTPPPPVVVDVPEPDETMPSTSDDAADAPVVVMVEPAPTAEDIPPQDTPETATGTQDETVTDVAEPEAPAPDAPDDEQVIASAPVVIDTPAPQDPDSAGDAGSPLAVSDITTPDAAMPDPAPADGTVDSAAEAAPTVVTIIDGPTGTTTDPATGITIRRPAGDTPVAPAAAEAEPLPALVEFAAFFDNPDALPQMSVILIDDGALPNGPRALQEVPFPVTIVLDPSRPGVSELMDAYRAGGFEVAARASLPQGGTAADVAVALEATFDALPQSVALVQTDGAALGRSDPATEQVVATLAADGRGLVQADSGLNGAATVADAQDVPNGVIFRDLTDVDQDARVIRRFMDQAAFHAGQQDGVILLARLTPETLSAMILWGTANRARQVAMAPLSATLLAGGD